MKNPTREEIDSQMEELCSPHPRTIKETSHTFFAYGDAPGGIGGGVGAFHWFKTKAEMLAWVKHFIVWEWPGPCSMDHDQVQDKVTKLFENYRKHRSLNRLRLALNKTLKRFSQIDWWGTFRDLRQSNEQFPRHVRTSFCESIDKPLGPIPPKQKKEFLEFLQTYGI